MSLLFMIGINLLILDHYYVCRINNYQINNMKISGNTTLNEIKTAFHNRFPYLQLEFYTQPHVQGEKTPEEFRITDNLTVSQVCKNYHAGFLSLDEKMKVGTFEQIMFDMFGLNVQVLRKSYDQWLQTWSTDMWTLEEQNRRGRIMGDESVAN